MFKVNTNKLENNKINTLTSYTFRTFNPLTTKDYIFLRPNTNNELNNNYQLLFEKDNSEDGSTRKYYKLDLIQQYSNITIFEINNIKFNLTNNVNQMNQFEFYYNPIENYIIFVV